MTGTFSAAPFSVLVYKTYYIFVHTHGMTPVVSGGCGRGLRWLEVQEISIDVDHRQGVELAVGAEIGYEAGFDGGVGF